MDNLRAILLIYWPMAKASDKLAASLAANVAALREKRGLTQQALAKLAGLPRSTVTYLESGSGNPSIRSLAQVAGALQISLEELLTPPHADCRLVKAVRIPKSVRSGGLTTLYQLLPDPIPGMQIDRLHMEPGALLGGTPHVAGTREYFTCLQGTFEIRVAGECHTVETGDVLAFRGDSKHQYANVGKSKAVGVSVVVLAHALA